MKRFNRQIWLEFLTIIGIALLFSALFLADETSLELVHLNPEHRLLALEHERLSGILIPVEISLKADPPHLPTWNPYLNTGTPLVNNAFFYLFNPFMSVPMILLGAVQGTKVVIIIGVLLAGFNMWALGKAIGLGGVARITIAALFMLSGGITGKYHDGHFQLALSLAWPPLVFAGLWWTLNSRDRRAPVLTAIAFALLFFSGNIYYALHTLICGAVIVLIHSIPKFDWLSVRRVLIAGGFAFGLTMLQFLPIWSVRDYVSHHNADFAADGQSPYELGQSIANFVVPWDKWTIFENAPINMLGSVDYAYIGPAVFAIIGGLITLPLVHNQITVHHRMAAVIAVVLAIIMMIWGAAQNGIVQALYRHITLLAEFRFLGRANSMAALWWILLAGIALDNLWRAARTLPNIPAKFDTDERIRLLRTITFALVVWAWYLVYSHGNNVTRLSLVLQNISLFNFMNGVRLTNYVEATQTLVNFVVFALLIDSILRIARLSFSDLKIRYGANRQQLLVTRGIRLVLVVAALIAINDVMYVNYRIIRFGPQAEDLMPLYNYVQANDITAPFPAIQEPWSPATYTSYYNRIRNWGLNEGWVPLPQDNHLIPRNAPQLTKTPRWAIAATGDANDRIQSLARAFVEANNGVLVECAEGITNVATPPCNPATADTHNLHEIPDSLPYAFVTEETTLKTAADTLTRANTVSITVATHNLDEIILQATTSNTLSDSRAILVVQETNFPGWEANVDGRPTPHYTVGTVAPGGSRGGFIGVPLQPGTHTYTLRYEPPGFKLGIIISAVTVVGMLLYLAGVTWPARSTTQAPAPSIPPIVTPHVPETEVAEPETSPTRVLPRWLMSLVPIMVLGIAFIASRLGNKK